MIKKINGYRIFMHKQLGKGAYGVVSYGLYRFTKDSNRTQILLVLLKFFKKIAVNNQNIHSQFWPLLKSCINIRNQNYEGFKIS